MTRGDTNTEDEMDTMKNDTFRIDRSTGQIYELNNDGDAYEFLCTFYQIGAESRNRDSTIISKIEAWKK